MFSRRALATALFALPLAFSIPAFAGMKYSAGALADAQKTGKPILVEISAPWCSTCKAQKVVLGELEKQPKFKDLMKLEVDFDTQKADVKALNASMQSTLIVYKGGKEAGRLVGETKREAIEALLNKAL